MVVTLNGRAEEVTEGETVEGLLRRIDLEGRYALVERNGDPVERKDYARLRLESGDVLVVARPVAGG